MEIAGNTYTAEYLADISISKTVDGLGTSGISSSQISGKVLTSYRFPEGSAVIVHYSGWEFPTYYISYPEYDGTAMSFTAYDRCKDLDIPFDNSAYPLYEENSEETESESTESESTESESTEKKRKKEAKYLASQIVQNIAAQTGFTQCNYVPQTMYITGSQLKDTTCRAILQMITEADLGTAYCGNDDSLRFVSALSSGSGASVKSGEYSPIIEKSHKTYSKLIAEDTKNNKIYEYGNGDYSTCLMISGTLMNDTVASAIASQLMAQNGLDYLAFSIDDVIISSNMEIFGQLFIQDNGTKYICRQIRINFTATGAVASVSSPPMSESKSEYINKLMRLSKSKLSLDTRYNTFFVNKTGAGHVLKI